MLFASTFFAHFMPCGCIWGKTMQSRFSSTIYKISIDAIKFHMNFINSCNFIAFFTLVRSSFFLDGHIGVQKNPKTWN